MSASAQVFVDTNVLVYARDSSEPAKQPAAERWLRRLWSERMGRVSAQVLNEYYVVVTEKLVPGISREEARADVRDLWWWEPILTGPEVVDAAWAIQDRFGLSWWDALIVAAARMGGCSYLLTEDLGAGRSFDGVLVVDPFATPPEALLG